MKIIHCKIGKINFFSANLKIITIITICAMLLGGCRIRAIIANIASMWGFRLNHSILFIFHSFLSSFDQK